MIAFMYGIAWAGIVMLFDFSMWSGGFLEWYYNTISKLPKFLAKPLGTCKPCFSFWWGALAYYFLFGINIEYLLFLGISEMIIIFYSLVLLFYKKLSNK